MQTTFQNKSILLGVALAIALSSISLGLQVRQTTSKFAKYRRTPPTDLQFRFLEADVVSLRERMPSDRGVPFVVGFTPDHKKLIMRVEVLSDELPKSIGERRAAFMSSAIAAVSGFAEAFGDDPTLKSEKDLIVEFVDVLPVAHNQKPEVIATFENGELSFH